MSDGGTQGRFSFTYNLIFECRSNIQNHLPITHWQITILTNESHSHNIFCHLFVLYVPILYTVNTQWSPLILSLMHFYVRLQMYVICWAIDMGKFIGTNAVDVILILSSYQCNPIVINWSNKLWDSIDGREIVNRSRWNSYKCVFSSFIVSQSHRSTYTQLVLNTAPTQNIEIKWIREYNWMAAEAATE